MQPHITDSAATASLNSLVDNDPNTSGEMADEDPVSFKLNFIIYINKNIIQEPHERVYREELKWYFLIEYLAVLSLLNTHFLGYIAL